MVISKLKKFLELALRQGEGFGTAYEYYVKYRLLSAFLAQSDCQPRSILLAGLPERYGYSLDMVLMSNELNAKLTVMDERKDHLKKFQELSYESGIFDKHCKLILLSDWNNLPLDDEYELIISCEVLQRLTASQRRSYVGEISKKAQCLAIFAPNSANRSHTKSAPLNSVSKQELKTLVSRTGLQVLDAGYLDAPPFPSGLRINRETRQGQRQNEYFKQAILLFLGAWTLVESICPRFLMRRFSHIVYVLAARNPEY